MELFNLFAEQDWDNENDRDGYRHRVTAIGKRLGAELLGASLYELPPGERTWPYHYEHASGTSRSSTTGRTSEPRATPASAPRRAATSAGRP